LYVRKIYVNLLINKKLLERINTTMNKIYCLECGNEEVTFDFRNQYYNYWICRCGNHFRTKKKEIKGKDQFACPECSEKVLKELGKKY